MQATGVLETYAVLEGEHLQHLLDALREAGYITIAPTRRDQAIVYDEIDTIEELPIGWTDEQQGGAYRLMRRDDGAFFGYTLGPQSWKKWLHPPRSRLWQAKLTTSGFEVVPEPSSAPRYAFVGVRACELAAIAIQDRVFMGSEFTDGGYQARREGVFIVAVNCSQAGGTCFCASMGTGPKASAGFDLALTEVITPDQHYFLVEVGSPLGAEVLEKIPHDRAAPEEIDAAAQVVEDTTLQMGRTLDTTDLKELLYANLEHPRWAEVAQRCLTCGNCTLVCPTCFCTSIEDVTDLAGETAERWRRWDSCFTMDFSYIHGGSVRYSGKARYRQWMTHKLASWVDQFGTFGCVGCGRCITWCPVGIDITEEAAAIRQTAGAKDTPKKGSKSGQDNA